MLTIKIAETQAELNTVYRFRYEIYVQELHAKMEYADHLNQTIVEPLDDGAVNIGAWDNGKLVAGIRMNLADEKGYEGYQKLFQMNSISGFTPHNFSICSKFMVDRTYRNSRLNILLQVFCYRIALEHDIRFCFIDCRDPLISYYKKFGFRTYMEPIPHGECGHVTPLVVDTLDIDHLTSVGSPFAAIYNEIMFEKRLQSGIAA